MPLISVIVPIYKVEQYLAPCIESILCQSFHDFELILIDDGSPDRCGEICDAFAERDERIRVIHQENAGVSTARNLGLELARGEYVSFIDPDDLIHPQMFEILYAVLDNTQFPFVHCDFHFMRDSDENKVPEVKSIPLSQVQVLQSEQGFLKMLDGNYGHYIWKGMYRTSYIRDFSFRPGVRWEDVIWSGEVVGNAKQYAYLPIDLYSYRIHNLSLVRTYEWKEQRYYFSAFEEYVNIARRLVPRVATIVEIDVFYSIIVRENILFQHGCLNKPAKKEIRSSARACRVNAIKVLKSQNSIKRKLILLIGVVSFPLACFLRRKMVR